MALEIKFPDGSLREFPDDSTGYDIAKSISERLAQDALAVSIDGIVKDIDVPLKSGGQIQIHTFDSPIGKSVFWHSSAHVMAQAVKELYPGAKLGIGPAIEEGFYYDFDVAKPFTEEDLALIEKRMKQIIDGKHRFQREEISREEAIRRAKQEGEEYRLEIIDGLEGESIISYYHHDTFSDLCRGPHLPATDKIKAYKLLSVAGAYWRGDEHNKMLQRIYGIAFPKKAMLDEYLTRLEEA